MKWMLYVAIFLSALCSINAIGTFAYRPSRSNLAAVILNLGGTAVVVALWRIVRNLNARLR